MERFGLIVYPRRNEPVTAAELRRYWSEAEGAKLQAALMASAPEFPLSSTQIREFIKKNGVGSVSSFVTAPVAEYITSHGLYL